jgi:hypothetical protein
MPYVVCEEPWKIETFHWYRHSMLRSRRPSSSALGILNKIYLHTLRVSGLSRDISPSDISSSDISGSGGTSEILEGGFSGIGGMPGPVRIEPQVGRKDGKKEE